MALQPLDHLFARPEMVIAAHPYDLMQGACGLPLGRRAVTGLFMLRPSLSRYDELLRHTAEHPQLWDVEATKHTPEQMGLACFFANRSSLLTLPCPYLYDIGNAAHVSGERHYKGCVRWSPSGRAACDEVSEYIQTHCLWQQNFREVRAVHFKGSLKPFKDNGGCKHVQRGAMRLRSSNRNVSGIDDVAWDPRGRACTSHVSGEAVVWASGLPVQQRCCSPENMLKAYWHSL